MPKGVRIVNIERGRPTVEQARRRLRQAIEAAKRDGVAVIKVIHGYGSSGVGGALKGALRNSLRRRRKEGQIAAFIPGEEWSIFSEVSQKLLDKYPELQGDPDLERYNEGMTIVCVEGRAEGPEGG